MTIPADNALMAWEQAEIVANLERLRQLVTELEGLAGDSGERRRVRERMYREIDAAKETVRTFATHDTTNTAAHSSSTRSKSSPSRKRRT